MKLPITMVTKYLFVTDSVAAPFLKEQHPVEVEIFAGFIFVNFVSTKTRK